MGNVYAEITVTNNEDIMKADNGIIAEKDIRSVTMTALVDTGATTLIINEELCRQLGLNIEKPQTINLAGGVKGTCKITKPVKIQWKDRFVYSSAVVLDGGKPLLGVIPLEFMDLIVDPVHGELVGAHGDQAVLMAM